LPRCAGVPVTIPPAATRRPGCGTQRSGAGRPGPALTVECLRGRDGKQWSKLKSLTLTNPRPYPVYLSGDLSGGGSTHVSSVAGFAATCSTSLRTSPDGHNWSRSAVWSRTSCAGTPSSAGPVPPEKRIGDRTPMGDRSPMVIGHSSFRSQVPTGSCWTVEMTQPGPNPDNYPPIDPTEPVPDDPGPLSPDTPETLPPAPVEPMPGPDDPDSVPAGQSA
jgi:hypothetical protein